jgi:hypothetical protein
MTQDGIGISVIPPVVIQNELAAGALRIIETEVSLPGLNFTAALQNSADGFIADPVARLAISIAAESVKIEQN